MYKRKANSKKTITKHTRKEIDNVRQWFSLPRQVEAFRECLKCRRMFESTHIGNRVCEGCFKVAYNGFREGEIE